MYKCRWAEQGVSPILTPINDSYPLIRSFCPLGFSCLDFVVFFFFHLLIFLCYANYEKKWFLCTFPGIERVNVWFIFLCVYLTARSQLSYHSECSMIYSLKTKIKHRTHIYSWYIKHTNHTNHVSTPNIPALTITTSTIHLKPFQEQHLKTSRATRPLASTRGREYRGRGGRSSRTFKIYP